MTITVDVEVASDTPHPARIGPDLPAGAGSRAGKALRLRPQETIPRPPYCGLFDRWDLPLSDMYTPYVFPSENGLRCGTRELNYGSHQWRGDFQFNISRYSQQQLMETSHRHLLHAEEGTWLNIAFPYGDWWRRLPGARQCRRNSSLAPVATITSCSGVKNNNNRAGHVCRISRKEIHYVLFKKHELFGCSVYSFSFYFFIMGASLPVFPDLAT